MEEEEEEDWQETAFSSRHVHNRVAKHGGGGGAKGAKASFDVRRSFGTYEVNWGGGGAAQAPGKKPKSSSTTSTLELFRLSHDGHGLVGEIHLQGALAATVLLAGSRAALGALVPGGGAAHPDAAAGGRRPRQGTNNASPAGHDDAAGESAPRPEEGPGGERDDDDDDDDDAATDGEARERRRFRTFEKNSFRSPKFWLRFRGRPAPPRGGAAVAADGPELGGVGYLVFSGPQCRKFRGTLSCEALGWDNVQLSGWQAVRRSERDGAVRWGKETV